MLYNYKTKLYLYTNNSVYTTSMKKTILSLLAVITGITWLTFSTSCQKDYNATTADDTMIVRNPMQGQFSCLLNGIYYEADLKYYWDTAGTLSISTERFSPDKSERVYKTLAFTIHPYELPGTYKTSSGKVQGAYVNVDSFQTDNYYIVSVDTFENVTVTDNSGSVKGNFFFTLRPVGATDDSQDIKVTNGAFDIPKN